MIHTPESQEGSSEQIPQKPAHDISDMTQNIGEQIDALSLTEDQLKLKDMRERKEISEYDFDLIELYNFISAGIALKKADLEGRAIVLSKDDFNQVGGFMTVVLANGMEVTYESDTMNDPVLIIFPSDLA